MDNGIYIPDNAVIIDGAKPSLPVNFIRQLNQINTQLEVHWEKKLDKWSIWGRNKHGMPYMALLIKNDDGSYRPPDGRTLAQIRYNMWWSTRIRDRIWKMQNKYETMLEKTDEKLEDDSYQMGKEIAPVLRSLADAGTSSHGKSKFMHPGFGKSKQHGGDDI